MDQAPVWGAPYELASGTVRIRGGTHIRPLVCTAVIQQKGGDRQGRTPFLNHRWTSGVPGWGSPHGRVLSFLRWYLSGWESSASVSWLTAFSSSEVHRNLPNLHVPPAALNGWPAHSHIRDGYSGYGVDPNGPSLRARSVTLSTDSVKGVKVYSED